MTVQAVSPGQNYPIPEHSYGDDVLEVLIPEDKLQARIKEMAAKVSQHYRDTEEDVILICVLKGAVFFITDFARALDIPSQLEFMAVSSYGNSTTSSGVVRILKDLDRDIAGRDVILVEDVIDSGLTLKWLLRNLRGRKPRSLEVVSLFRKPDAAKAQLEFFDIGFDMPNEFLIGYGLDYAERYRDLPFVGSLRPEVYS